MHSSRGTGSGWESGCQSWARGTTSQHHHCYGRQLRSLTPSWAVKGECSFNDCTLRSLSSLLNDETRNSLVSTEAALCVRLRSPKESRSKADLIGARGRTPSLDTDLDSSASSNNFIIGLASMNCVRKGSGLRWRCRDDDAESLKGSIPTGLLGGTDTWSVSLISASTLSSLVSPT